MPNKSIGADFANPLRVRCVEFIDELVSEAVEETLHMEFKTLGDALGERLTKEDRKILARAICGMANADGGVILVGIETKRVDNLDVAIGKKPLGNASKMRNRLVAAIPEMLSPQHPAITAHSITESSENSEGYLIIEVPRSDNRPHYSNVHHQ